MYILKGMSFLLLLAHSMSLCNRAASVVRLSVRLKLLRKSLLLPQTWLDRHQTYTTWSPHGPASRVCSRSRSKVTWYGHFCDVTKYLRDVQSLHALTLRSTITLSFQYKCQAAKCNVYIMEWATPSLTVWFYYCIGLPIHCNCQLAHYSGFWRISPSILNRFTPNLQA